MKMKQVAKITHNYGTYAVYVYHYADGNPYLIPYKLFALCGKKKVYLDEFDSLTEAVNACLAYAMTGML